MTFPKKNLISETQKKIRPQENFKNTQRIINNNF